MIIASSGESLEYADALQVLLEPDFNVTVWNQGVFGLSGFVLDTFTSEIGRSSLGVVVSMGEDETSKRGTTSHSIRDNLLVEYGLMVGMLGRERTFLVVDKAQSTQLPTDLSGVTVAHFDSSRRDSLSVEALMGPVRTRIRAAARHLETARQPTLDVPALARSLSDFVGGLTSGVAGVTFAIQNPRLRTEWQKRMVQALHDLYRRRAEDVSVALLVGNPQARGPRKLRIRTSTGIADPAAYYAFSWNEGMAGRSWASGIASEHSLVRPNPWWTYRAGCENATYLCAPLIVGTDHLGLLAIGSDDGFALSDADLPLLEVFAKSLAPTLVPETKR